TAESDRKARQFIRRAISKNPSAYIIVTGCLAQSSPDDIAKIDGVDFICGNGEKLLAAKRLLEYFNSDKSKKAPEVYVNDINDADFENMTITKFDRTRAYVKIEDGCENRCSYCIIPSARGKVRSKPLQDIISEVEALAKNGCKEVVLTGIETASYGKDLGDITLAELLCRVDKIDGLERIRLGSLDPSLITPSFVERISSLKKLAPHFHLSLQSGSSRILALMRRKYNADMAMRAIELLRESMPHVCFTTDVIVGFPQESEADFNETAEFLKKARFLTVHIFPYSSRKGTEAAKMKGQIDSAEKSARLHALEKIACEARISILRDEIASSPVKSVLFETFDGAYVYGHTDNFLEVAVKSDADLKGEIFDVRLTSCDDSFCFGEFINKENLC
ncbi:MAG: tRNA (N(6)-L-threonylcarbamoyladenosine(37)-C(2))-methylthiotransferase MtaB, partial [Clostridia bacterium]|nr:tRNA (N(6)-L-threonylcarbamoyladenosine(37)-C(2))-methylthiotransferase MtaB [Clostridia bacterium]